METASSGALKLLKRRAPADRRQSPCFPLENLSNDPEQEYFADGLTEALITSLAKISALHVRSRTSAMKYRGMRTKSVPEIARELGVDRIVEGSVLRSGDQVRISAQLIDASKDIHLWAESYQRNLRDVLALQSEVARAIANEIRVKLTPQEQAQLTPSREVDPDAYESYLKGRYHRNKRTLAGLSKGMDYFQKAVQLDRAHSLCDAFVKTSNCYQTTSKRERSNGISWLEPDCPSALFLRSHERAIIMKESESEGRVSISRKVVDLKCF